MKKALAILLALSVLCAFAACGGNNPPDPDEPTSEITEIEPGTTAAVINTSETEPDSETETTTEQDAVTTTEAGPVDPTALDKAALVSYFNEAANRVRTEKPAFTYEVTNTIVNPQTQGGIAGLFSGIISNLIEKMMPGTTSIYKLKKGESNDEHFLSLLKATASSLKTGDVSSIKAEKSGDDYVITVRLGKATNPADGGASAYSRLFEIKTPQQTLDNIAKENSLVSGDAKNVTLEYHSGNAVMTVDAQGRVQSLRGGYDVNASAKEVKMAGSKTNFTCQQTSRIAAKGFAW